jgi:hypothetical protein
MDMNFPFYFVGITLRFPGAFHKSNRMMNNLSRHRESPNRLHGNQGNAIAAEDQYYSYGFSVTSVASIHPESFVLHRQFRRQNVQIVPQVAAMQHPLPG